MSTKLEKRLLYEFIYDHIVEAGVEVLRCVNFWSQTFQVS